LIDNEIIRLNNFQYFCYIAQQNNMEEKLLKYQIPHYYQLEEVLKVRNCALDASDTGTGKTYVAIALAYSLNKKPFIVCPKSVIPNWIAVAKTLGVELFGIANYELLKGCKYYNSKMEKLDFPYVKKYRKIISNDSNRNDSKQTDEDLSKKPIIEDYAFTLPNDVMVIFDEAHRCKNHKSVTSRLLLSIVKCKCKLLLLSATLSDKIKCFKPFGVVFGFYDDVKKFNMWIRKIIKSQTVYFQKKKDLMTLDQKYLDVIHRKLFPDYGSRMKIKELGSMFPSNQVLSQSYMSQDQEAIQEQYDIIQDAFEALKQAETRSEGLGKLIRARMKIEMLKVPIMLDIIEEAIDSNYSVAVFVNYVETMNFLAHFFVTDCLIHGDQTMEERQDSIDQFQSNRSKIIIANIQAGGVGISLHDIHGGHPRMSVISPTWSGQDIHQVLGRIHRAGSQSPALQRIVFVAGTYEERICELIQKKLINITGINDGDLIGPKFTDESFKEIEKDVEKINCIASLNDLSKHCIDAIDDNAKDNQDNSKNNQDDSENNQDNSENNQDDSENNQDDLENNQNNSKPITSMENHNSVKMDEKIQKNGKKYTRIVDNKDKRHFIKESSVASADNITIHRDEMGQKKIFAKNPRTDYSKRNRGKN
jgi:superfamily II DNA or RNA helicase